MSIKLEEFHFTLGQTVYLKEDNTQLVIQELYNNSIPYINGGCPTYKVKYTDGKSYTAKQIQLTSNDSTEYKNCAFRVGDIAYSKHNKIKVEDVSLINDKFLIHTTLKEGKVTFYEHELSLLKYSKTLSILGFYPH